MKPLAIDLFCGLGGWTEGFLAEGYDVVGFDIERHQYGDQKYPAQLVLQDVLTLHGSQFRNAAVIVASPPCQAYSYRAMPWKRAKALPPPDNTLFEACFRIQREATEATGHDCPACYGLGPRHRGHVCPKCNGTCWVTRQIPLVVENVKGAQPWVGRARWHYGSFYLWGDIPALMPSARHFKVAAYSDPRRNGGPGKHLTSPRENEDGLKVPGIKLSQVGFNVAAAQNYRKSKCHELHLGHGRRDSRKAAAAQIAKIPLPLSTWIARCFKPDQEQYA